MRGGPFALIIDQQPAETSPGCGAYRTEIIGAGNSSRLHHLMVAACKDRASSFAGIRDGKIPKRDSRERP